MKIIYVAGKYNPVDGTEWELERNIHHAEVEARKLWLDGWAVICPHKNTAHFGAYGKVDKDLWRNGDLEILRRCDAIYMLSNYKESMGALAELKLAQELGREVYYEEP